MTTENNCPFCGTSLEGNTSNQCPSCGSALHTSSNSAPTLISKKPVFNSSAEIMDEVKNLIREGDQSGATEVLSSQFGLSQEAAQSTVEQTEIDMSHTGREVPPAEPEATYVSSKPEIIDAPKSQEKKSGISKNWIIGGSIGAVVFLCVCCCLPIVGWLIWVNQGQ
jgi:hypothetical protein